MAGQQRTGILAAGPALEQRLEQVPHNGQHAKERGDRQGQPEAPALDQGSAERTRPQAGQTNPDHGAQHTRDGAFDGLAPD